MKRFYRAMMLVTMALAAQMANAYAGPSGKLANPQHNALVHVAVTEAYLDEAQIKAIVQIVSNRAYIYGDPDNFSKVVYNPREMFGPLNKPTPWVGEEAGRFAQTAAILRPYFGKLEAGKLIAPKLATAWHFDMKHQPAWGKLLAKYCFTEKRTGIQRCLYVQEARNKDVTASLKRRAARQG